MVTTTEHEAARRLADLGMIAEKVPFTDAAGSREIILVRVADDGEAVITCDSWQQVADFCDEYDAYDTFQGGA